MKTTKASFAPRRSLVSQLDKTFSSFETKIGLKHKEPSGFFNNAITIILALIFGLTPIFFSGLTSQGLGFEKMLLFYFLVLAGVILWITKGISIGEIALKRTYLDFPILAFIIFLLTSSFVSVGVKDSLIGGYGSISKSVISFLIVILFYYFLVNNLDRNKIKVIFWSFITSAFFINLISLIHLFGFKFLTFKLKQAEGYNPLGSISGLSIFLTISIPLFVIGFTKIKEIHSSINSTFALIIRIFLGFSIATSLISLILLNGFSLWVWPMIAIICALILIFTISKIITLENKNLILPILIFLTAITFIVLGKDFKPFEEKIKKISLPSEITLSRQASWNIAKSALKENPIFGSGPATFYYNFNKFRSNDFNNTPLWSVQFDSSGMAFFEFLATLGILGTILLVIIGLISIFSFIAYSLKTEEEIKPLLIAILISFISLIGFFCLFSFNSSLIIILFLIGSLATSITFALNEDEKKITLNLHSSQKNSLGLSTIFLGAGAGAIILLALGFKLCLSDVYAKQAFNTPDLNKKLELMQKATSLVSFQDDYQVGLSNIYIALFSQYLNENKNNEATNAIVSGIDSAKKAVELAPKKSFVYQNLATLYENAYAINKGSLELSKINYMEAAKLEPTNPTFNVKLALIDVARANSETEQKEKKFYLEEAIKKYDEALKQKPDLSQAYYGKSITQENLGDLDEAIKDLSNAVSIEPNNQNYRFDLARLYFNRGVGSQENNSLNNEASSTPENSQTINKNNDLEASEQLFLSVLLVDQNHANARYSLALLYKKVGDREKAGIMVKSLLNIVKDEKQQEIIKQQFPGLF